MTFRIRLAPILFVTTMLFTASGVWGAEPDEEMRKGAKLIASMEGPMAKSDLKGYCAATRGSPDYPGYLMRACEMSVNNKLKKAEACTDSSIKQEVGKDKAICLTMSAADFDKEMAIQRKGWENTLRQMKEKGVDTEKLMSEERVKVR